MTCLLEVPKHIAFLYMKPDCLELCVPSRDKSECINYCKKHKVTQTKKKPRAFDHLAFFRKRAFEQDCSTFCEHLENLCASIRATA